MNYWKNREIFILNATQKQIVDTERQILLDIYNNFITDGTAKELFLLTYNLRELV